MSNVKYNILSKIISSSLLTSYYNKQFLSVLKGHQLAYLKMIAKHLNNA